MKANIFSVLILIFACFTFTSCEEEPNNGSSSEVKSINITEGELIIAKQNNQFAWNMFSHIIDEKGNTIVSPLSASFAMCMAADGANGETRDEIYRALGFENSNSADVNGYMHKLSTQLMSLDPKTTVSIANSLWYNKSYNILDSYISSLNTSYNAEVFPLNSTNPVDKINNWCSKKTNGYINNLFKPGDISEFTASILVNALYFNGEWKEKFDKKETSRGVFHSSDGISVVDFMKGKINLEHIVAKTFTMASLDFGNSAYKARFILPNINNSFNDCINEINSIGWDNINQCYTKCKMTIKIPKFTIKSILDMKPIYQQMGIELAFNGNLADFSNMSPINSICITNAIQSNYFEIDEDGATAASTSGVIIGDYANLSSFVLDRPFIFALTERSTGAILFIGKIEKL